MLNNADNKGETSYNLLQDAMIYGDFALDRQELKTSGIDSELLVDSEFYHHYKEPKNSLNRENNASEQIFYETGFEYQTIRKDNVEIKPFLYFFTDQEPTADMKAALNLLAEEGIGANRNTGKGSFEKITVKVVNPQFKSSLFINLSLLYPQESSFDPSVLVSYDFIKRGGYIYAGGGTSQRKTVLRMFTEGSVFTKPLPGAYFQEKTLIPDRMITQNGKALMVGGGK
jgi:CRISPR-associated protein Csm4